MNHKCTIWKCIGNYPYNTNIFHPLDSAIQIVGTLEEIEKTLNKNYTNVRISSIKYPDYTSGMVDAFYNGEKTVIYFRLNGMSDKALKICLENNSLSGEVGLVYDYLLEKFNLPKSITPGQVAPLIGLDKFKAAVYLATLRSQNERENLLLLSHG